MHLGSRNRPDNTGAAWVALGISALLHIPLLLLIAVLQPDQEVLETTNFDATSEFSIDLVTEPPDEKKPEDEENPEERLQYVSLPAPVEEKRPDEARFADQFDEVAEKETVKKAAPGAPAPPKAMPTPQTEPVPESKTEGEIPEEKAEEPKPEREETPDGVSATERAESAPPAPSPQKLFPGLADPMAAEVVGEGGSNDYLRDVEEGDRTLLNRKRTRYWAFFDRVKRQISKQWSPVSEYRKRDPYGNVYGVKDRYSTVDVTLNGDGSVRRLYLSRTSGLDFFDDEAVRAIQSAAPFHNPPEGLKDEDGLVHFTFGFYFEIASGSFRFIRINN